MKIDIHTHILPREWPDLDKKFGYPGFVRLEHCDECSARMMIGDRVFREITDNVWNPERRIEEMDRTGVSMQVLSTVPVMFSYWAKPKDALDLCRILNDHIAEVVRANPKRFAGLGTIPLQDVDLAAQELSRCVRELGLRGVEVGMLFIDFEKQNRMRVDGEAHIDVDDPLIDQWPRAQLVVRVTTKRVYPNCPRYIHHCTLVERSRFVPRAEAAPPVPDWKRMDWACDVLPADDPARG